MAFYQLQNDKTKEKTRERTIGIVLLVIISFVFLFLFTNLVGFMKTFLLGVFGLFAYPLSLTIFFVSIAMINNKKYVMSKRYAIYLSLCLVFTLAILQLIILGKPDVTFFEYLGLSYIRGLTAGGILISLLCGPIIYLLDLLSGYIFFILALIISLALTVDYMHYFKKNIQLKSPFLIFSKAQKIGSTHQKSVQNTLKEEVKITLDHKIMEDEKENSAKTKLGLIAGTNFAKQVQKPENVYEYIMTPPSVDLSHYSQTRKANEET